CSSNSDCTSENTSISIEFKSSGGSGGLEKNKKKRISDALKFPGVRRHGNRTSRSSTPSPHR
ncbi:hypothetical protein, partial [Klebsiella pneumoniae]|uniref:hypothetical protein n=1 Tax=Klebsiella pneumoniae TaxID=573 RepID=UPI00405583FB